MRGKIRVVIFDLAQRSDSETEGLT